MKSLGAYAFANAKIHAMLGRLFDASVIDELVQAEEYTKFITELKNTQYFSALQNIPVEDITAFEKSLFEYDRAIFLKIAKCFKKREKDFVFLLLERYRLDEVKYAVRLYLAQYAGVTVSRDEFLSYIKEDIYKEVLSSVWEEYVRSGSSFYLESALEKDYFSRLWKNTFSLLPDDRHTLQYILYLEADMENQLRIMRFNRYYKLEDKEMLNHLIPWGRVFKQAEKGKIPLSQQAEAHNGDIAAFEIDLRILFLRKLKRLLRAYPFTIMTVLSFLILKQNETKNIITIANCKKHSLTAEETKRMVLC